MATNINERSAFRDGVAPIATAVPAFVGYTPQAQHNGVSLYNRAQRITSLADFQACFMLREPARQYSPAYYLVAQAQPSTGVPVAIDGQHYAIVPDPDTLYYLYNSVRLFYENGGGDAYIVAVGGYGPASKQPMNSAARNPINANVRLADLQRGLALLQTEPEPTIYLCPEATLLAPQDTAVLMQDMLRQAHALGTAVCLFDVAGGAVADSLRFFDDIQAFRNSTGSAGLKHGISYYPFIGTAIMQPGEIDFTNLYGGDIGQLAAIVDPASAPNPAAARILAQMKSAHTVGPLHAALLDASPVYQQIVARVLEVANVLPPSGAMAGIYTLIDNRQGVWQAPANVAIAGAVSLPMDLSDEQQADLMLDLSGKSINAIRAFDGQGILVWGARTLDANSQDWRYVPLCRTMIFLEQSVARAARAFVFEPNDATTWSALNGMIVDFLTGLWQQGGLQGATAHDAFTVAVGLGTTMTADDVHNGRLRIMVTVALVSPAEFLVFTIEQQQAIAG